MVMKNPGRPGEIVGAIIREQGLTITDAAKHLGVTRQTLNNLINNERVAVSAEMAVRLEAVIGSTTESWLRMQASYDAAVIGARSAEITHGLKRISAAAE